MITEKEKFVFKRLVLSPEWSVLVKLAEEMIQDVKQRVKLQSTEWETLIAVIGDEKEEDGIRKLIQTVQRMAKESK